MKIIRAYTVLILSLVFMNLEAQEVTGRLEGRVLDHHGKLLAGVQVTVSGASLQGARQAVSDKRGYFRFFSLPSGVYALRFEREPFHELLMEEVRVGLGRTTALGEIRLQPLYVEEHRIIVRGTPPLIDPTTTTVGTNLTAVTVQDLPVARDYRSVLAMLPGTARSSYGDDVNISGATGSENLYAIDGIDVSDPYLRYKNTQLPYNFVKEIEIKTGGYEAQYRSSLGGLVNTVTFSGGNEFSGQAFGFFTDNNFSQSGLRSELEPGSGKYSQYDYGFSLGGPIQRDKLWFFLAYNSIAKNENIMLPSLREYKDRWYGDLFAAKLNWRPSQKTDVMLTFLGDPAGQDRVGSPIIGVIVASALNPDPMLSRIREGGFHLLASGSYVFSNDLFFEASLAISSRRDRTEPATERGSDDLCFMDFYSGSVISGGHFGKTNADSLQTTATCKGTLVLGRHILKAGLEYRDNSLSFSQNGRILARFLESFYIFQSQIGNGTVRNRIPSLFIQDSWRPSDRLQLNFGLRWSAESLVASNGRVAQRIGDEFQPRIGFIFQPGRTGSSRIIASYGRFYGELSTYFMTWYMMEGNQFHSISYAHDPRLDPNGGYDESSAGGSIQPRINGLRGQNYDEFTLGFEQVLSGRIKAGIQGIYRNLNDVIEDGFDPLDGLYYFGNPGRPPLEDKLPMRREYLGLQLTFIKTGGKRFDFSAAYTLSRSYGNYPGLFSQDQGDNRTNISLYFDSPLQESLATGLLPNDRPHLFKFFGSYRFRFRLSVGAFFQWQSGTPLSELGTQYFQAYPMFLSQRGKAGRTPAIADLNLRIAYQFKDIFNTGISPRILLDLFHIGSKRTPVTYNERRYFGIDEHGNPTDPNPLYMKPTGFFPPMSARLGMEINL